MYLAHELTGATLRDVGHFFGGRDHTTVLHALKKVPGMLARDVRLRAFVDAALARPFHDEKVVEKASTKRERVVSKRA